MSESKNHVEPVEPVDPEQDEGEESDEYDNLEVRVTPIMCSTHV